MVGALSVTETISYGILAYAFTVFIAPMRAELGWSVASLTGAYSLGLLTAGIAAVPLGRWLDEHGARLPMSLGSLLAAALLLAWSAVGTPWSFYLIWAGLGVAMAALLYEPAFVVLATWFRRDLGRALTVLTFLAGFASVIFIPLAGFLVDAYGWRTAVRLLAAVQLATFPLHALLLRRRPADLGLAVDGFRSPVGEETPATDGLTAGEAFARPDFRRLAIAFSLSTFVITAIGVHLVPLLVATGTSLTAAAGIGGAIGLMALPGRVILTPLGDVWPRRLVAAGIFGLQALGLLTLFGWSGTSFALWAFSTARYTRGRRALQRIGRGGTFVGRMARSAVRTSSKVTKAFGLACWITASSLRERFLGITLNAMLTSPSRPLAFITVTVQPASRSAVVTSALFVGVTTRIRVLPSASQSLMVQPTRVPVA
jgi:MFS family permease